MSSKSPEIQAIELIAPRKFHRLFVAPATETRGPLRVSYSIAGVEEGKDVETIVFCGGMFGTRWQAVFMDWLATKNGVRVLFIDRPGFGTSTVVPIRDRIQTVLEVIPLLLAHLKITHISLASQSAGTLYAFNLLSAYPDLLSPTNPSITFFSPWVHQSISSVSFLRLASTLPNNLLNGWNSIVGFIVNTAQPAFAVSGGAITAASSLFKSKLVTAKETAEEERKCMEGLGIGLDVRDELNKLMFKHCFAESTVGGNDEARLCLKSVEGTGWHACEDYEEFIRNLAMVWEKRVEDGGKKLKVNVVLPEEDDMTGVKGMEYFRKCWGEERVGEGIEVRIVTLEGTNHDTTAASSEPYLAKMFEELKSGIIVM